MNERQNRILKITSVIIAIMLVFPPFDVRDNTYWRVTTEYSLILDAPKYGQLGLGTLFIQWVGVLIVSGIAFFLASEGDK